MSSTCDRFAQEFGESLQGFLPNEIGAWAQSVIRLMRRFAVACEMDGPVFLVPDNNIIQDFKHQDKKLNRRLRSLSYKAFCRFVTGWSHRKTYIAVGEFYTQRYSRFEYTLSKVDFRLQFQTVDATHC